MSLTNREDIKMWQVDGQDNLKNSNIFIELVWTAKRCETDKITTLIYFVIIMCILIDTEFI